MKIKTLLLVGAAAMSLAACTQVQPGHVGIKVNNFGSSAGVSERSLPVGVYMTAPGTNIYKYPIFTSTYAWTSTNEGLNGVDEAFRFQDKNGLELSADVSIAFRVDPTKAPTLFQKYRTDMDGIVAGPLRNAVRSAIGNQSAKMGVEEIYGPRKAELSASALADVQKYFAPYGLIVEQLYWASNIKVPEAVTAQINQKIANEQAALAAQASVATAEAQARSAVAKAEGKAQAMRIEAAAISANPQVLELRAIEKWNGVLPQVTSGGTPFVSLK